MGFASGRISFRRFAVIGTTHITPDQELIDKLQEHALREQELGVPEEHEYGWSGGAHVFDGQFSFERNVFADCLHFALRIDTNKVPAATKKAWQAIEEDAAAKNNPSGFISKNQKRDAKEAVRRKAEDELRSGKFRRSRLIPVLWDLASQTLYCSATGATFEKLSEIFERSFGLTLIPITSGALAQPHRSGIHHGELKPTRFVIGPEGEGQYPDYPWISRSAEEKDFLGNEFLLWLWHGLQKDQSIGGVAGFFDVGLDLQCAYGQTGKDSLRGDGPTIMPEARDALRVGKVPRKAGLILDHNRQMFAFALTGDSMAVGGAKLPDVDDAESPRVLFEERIGLLRDLCKTIDGLFAEFLKVRTSSAWEGHVMDMRRWIMRLDTIRHVHTIDAGDEDPKAAMDKASSELQATQRP